MITAISIADVTNPIVFDDRAHALAAELSSAKYCDLLTALFWVICGDVLQVASLRIDTLDGELASEWVRHPASLADHFADPDHVSEIDVVETWPSRALWAALERGDVGSVGIFPGEIEPRLIAGSVWAAGVICGGEVGRRELR